ncbi:hypothetical protein [Streptomyces albidoflavus]|uniref:hypothetical protein n=1 Tax=Streptomyces albidoflavus TaxID=1886 RepID=UPI0033E0CAE4
MRIELPMDEIRVALAQGLSVEAIAALTGTTAVVVKQALRVTGTPIPRPRTIPAAPEVPLSVQVAEAYRKAGRQANPLVLAHQFGITPELLLRLLEEAKVPLLRRHRRLPSGWS